MKKNYISGVSARVRIVYYSSKFILAALIAIDTRGNVLIVAFLT
jgi:hypothetical protein